MKMILGFMLMAASAGFLGPVPGAAQDSAGIPDGLRAERLRQLIEERFAERLTIELGLTDDQVARVRGVLTTWATKRRTLEREDRSLRDQLAGAMRRGVAADERTVIRLTDRILAARIEYVQTFKDEIGDLAPVLSPVQRAQYVLLRDRLMQRVQEIRSQRAANLPQARPNRLRP